MPAIRTLDQVVRKHKRDTTFLNRHGAMHAGDRLKVISLRKQLGMLIAFQAGGPLLEPMLTQSIEHIVSELHELRKVRKVKRRTIEAIHLRYQTIDEYNSGEAYQLTGFSTSELRRIFDALDFPARLQVDPRSGRTWTVPGEVAFLLLLWRFHTGTLLTQSERIWGYTYSALSKISKAAAKFFKDNHLFRLWNLEPFAPYFELYNRAVLAKCEDLGHDVPAELADIFGFYDACQVETARPTVSCRVCTCSVYG
jgi:hypothetical protein